MRPAHRADRLGDAALPRLGCLGLLDGEHQPPLVAVGQRIKAPFGLRIVIERLLEIGRHCHLAGRCIEFDVDLHLVTASNTRIVADQGADPKHAPRITATVLRQV